MIQLLNIGNCRVENYKIIPLSQFLCNWMTKQTSIITARFPAEQVKPEIPVKIFHVITNLKIPFPLQLSMK